jgi:ATP-dependent DNA helicase RecG
VCPRIGDDGGDEDLLELEIDDESETKHLLASVLDTAEYLVSGPLAGLRVGILHGRMSSDDKEAAMSAFANVKADPGIDVLVSTTVIEVGVDVPDATAMVVLDADRFGISQLHQLRGRVGRGKLPGLCLLLTQADPGSPARQRLDAVASTTDGFELARLDLAQRREGDVLGASQSGRRSSLKLLQVVTDVEVIEEARAAANKVISIDPNLDSHPDLRTALAELVAEDQAEFMEKA